MLTKPLAICVNRLGQSLDTANQIADTVGWPVIGVDPRDIVLVDAGNAIVGFSFQILSILAVETGGSCAGDAQFLESVSSTASLASSFEFATPSVDEDAAKAARHLEVEPALARGRTHVGASGRQRLHWTDVNGNLISFVEFGEAGLKGKRGSHYRRLLELRGFQLGKGRKGKFDNPAPLVGVTLLVTDLERSRRFYEHELGLTVVDADRDDVTLDAGNIMLRLRPEPTLGLVRGYRRNRELRDQISFYTPDIDAEVANLTARGISFPRGIERTISAGALAKFLDPDGYNLWLWQSQPDYIEGMPINYFPVLSRILREHDAPLPREAYTGAYTQTFVPQPPNTTVLA